MNQLCTRRGGNRKMEKTGSRLGTSGSLEIFWKPATPFMPRWIMDQKVTKIFPTNDIEQKNPAEVPVYPLAILVVEDNRINRVLTMKMLSHLGYTADAVINGGECMQAMARKTYDLCLMDLQMPVM